MSKLLDNFFKFIFREHACRRKWAQPCLVHRKPFLELLSPLPTISFTTNISASRGYQQVTMPCGANRVRHLFSPGECWCEYTAGVESKDPVLHSCMELAGDLSCAKNGSLEGGPPCWWESFSPSVPLLLAHDWGVVLSLQMLDISMVFYLLLAPRLKDPHLACKPCSAKNSKCWSCLRGITWK